MAKVALNREDKVALYEQQRFQRNHTGYNWV